MSKFIGKRLSVGIGKELTRGRDVAPTFWLNALAFNHEDKVNKARAAGISGGIWGDTAALVTTKWAEGDIEAEMGDASFGLILLATLGTSTPAVFSGAVKHTYTLQNDNIHDSLTIVAKDPDRDLVFELSMLESLRIEFVPDDLVKYTASFKSRSSAAGSNTASYTAENKFLGRHLAFKYADATADLDAASAICLQRLVLTFEKNLQEIDCLGTVQKKDILNKLFNISMELDLLYEDDVEKNLMMTSGTYQAVRIDLVNKDVTIGTTNPAFRLDLSKCDFEGWEADYAMGDIVNQRITANALYDFTNGNVINSCYIVNETESY